jgi:hypothetical protein
MNLTAINAFSKDPDNYLLQVNTVKGKTEFNVLKKGFWTWIKIHLGSRLRLFDRSTVSLSDIAKKVFKENELAGLKSDQRFVEALDYKILHWNSRHDPKEAIEIADSKPVSLTRATPGKFQELFSLKEAYEVSDKILDKLPKNLWEYTSCDKSKQEIVLHLQRYWNWGTWGLKEKYSGLPNLEKVLSYLNEGSEEGRKELDKLAGTDLTFDLKISLVSPNQCQANITLFKERRWP